MPGRHGDCLAPAVVGRVTLSGQACRPPGDQSGVAPARLGRHACERHRPAGVCPGDSRRVGRHGGGAAVSQDGSPAGYQFRVAGDTEEPPPRTAGPIVGRQPAVERLETWFQRAVHGARQLVFVSGDVGIGKTTVVDLFLAHLAAGSGVRTGRGQCVEHYGEGEPYLPFLEALWQLAHGPAQDTLLAVLRRYAPLWLVQLPGLVSEPELERLQRQVAGATPARMQRELAQALDVLAADAPLVLVLEDLQWSDRSTVDLLASLAQRREPAQLLVLGTYRPVDVVLQAHPLHTMVQELGGRGQVRELPLELLTAEDVAAYLAGRLRGPIAAPLAAFVYERTEGNALFMVNFVEHLVQQRLLARHEGQWTLRAEEEARVAQLPEEVRQLLMRRLDALPAAARRVLEVASVVGQEFAAAAVAAGTQGPVDDVEGICDGLAAQGRFIADTGLTVWPDGTSSGRYRFHHALYPQVLYEALGTARRGRLHHQVGASLEAGYGARAGEIASQLAVHFERGGEVQRAVHYWQQAGANAARRMPIMTRSPPSRKGWRSSRHCRTVPSATRRELTLLLTLGESDGGARAWGLRKRAKPTPGPTQLCPQVGEPRQRFQVLRGLFRFHRTQGQWRTAGALSQQLFAPRAPPARQPPLAGGPYGRGIRRVLSWRPGHGPGPSGAKSTPLRTLNCPPSLPRWVCCLGDTSSPCSRRPSGRWAMRTRPRSGVRKRWPWPSRSGISPAWRMRKALPPASASTAETRRPHRHTPTPS